MYVCVNACLCVRREREWVRERERCRSNCCPGTYSSSYQYNVISIILVWWRVCSSLWMWEIFRLRWTCNNMPPKLGVSQSFCSYFSYFLHICGYSFPVHHWIASQWWMFCMQSLYKGAGIVAILTSAGSGLYFATYETIKRLHHAEGTGMFSQKFFWALVVRTRSPCGHVVPSVLRIYALHLDHAHVPCIHYYVHMMQCCICNKKSAWHNTEHKSTWCHRGAICPSGSWSDGQCCGWVGVDTNGSCQTEATGICWVPIQKVCVLALSVFKHGKQPQCLCVLITWLWCVMITLIHKMMILSLLLYFQPLAWAVLYLERRWLEKWCSQRLLGWFCYVWAILRNLFCHIWALEGEIIPRNDFCIV